MLCAAPPLPAGKPALHLPMHAPGKERVEAGFKFTHNPTQQYMQHTGWVGTRLGWYQPELVPGCTFHIGRRAKFSSPASSEALDGRGGAGAAGGCMGGSGDAADCGVGGCERGRGWGELITISPSSSASIAAACARFASSVCST